ncbi:hypothetical protein BW727_200021 (plasmid) [Jeotgalibaca dankookensis]|uniref:HTH cro/C1-type domain-containing protein n=1 Tax=Jeotgalibaca dankookensis TaxID=708126 RepID=A0A1S6ISB0_9LACT|nr:Rgg/GadR/MutR family transcriptional regulator [Jeotgalibaca dankookensis]AQS54424.1 hypothetical protein BW727_200021 [Jeotgalibaca dankookensis]
MKTGEVVKHIRLSKKLKSKNVYHNILSRPAISRFENGTSDTTTEKFFKILDNLNISLEEFHFIYSNYRRNTSHIFLDEYLPAFYLQDVEKLKELKLIMKREYKKTSKINQLHYLALSELTINYLLNQQPSTDSLNILKNYLLECENWTYYELMLFTNSLDFFPNDLIILLYKRTKQKLKEYKLLNRFNNEVFSLITNILVVFIEKNDIQKSTFFYNELKNGLSESKSKVYDKIMLAFFEELIAIMSSKKYDNNKIDTIISIFTDLDMPLKKRQCVLLFETVKQNNMTKKLKI